MFTRVFRSWDKPATPEKTAEPVPSKPGRLVEIDLDAPDPEKCKMVFSAAGKLWGRGRGRPRKTEAKPEVSAPKESQPPAAETK